MTNHSIVIDQTLIRVSDDLAARMKPGAGFPRSLDWWQRIVPCWLTASEDIVGHIVLAPNGHRADGHVYDLTPAVVRRDLGYARKFLAEWNRGHINLTDAVVNP